METPNPFTKSRLIEICRSKNIRTPEFISSSRGDPHKLDWYSEVQIDGKIFYSGVAQRTKTLAEAAASSIAIRYLAELDRVDQDTEELKGVKTIVLIDLENQKPDVASLQKPTYEYHMFYSSFSTVNTSAYENYAKLHMIDMGQSEAADHYLTFWTARHSMSAEKNTNYIVVSRDKSSEVIVWLLKAEGFNVLHYKSAELLR